MVILVQIFEPVLDILVIWILLNSYTSEQTHPDLRRPTSKPTKKNLIPERDLILTQNKHYPK